MAEPFSLGDTTPEYTSITIQRKGDTVELQAYVYGDRCPGAVKSKITSAHNAMVRDRKAMAHLRPASADADAETWTPMDVWYDYIREVVRALVPDLTYQEADNVIGNPDLTARLLIHLKYWTQEALDENPPSVPVSPQTMPESAPTSPPLESEAELVETVS